MKRETGGPEKAADEWLDGEKGLREHVHAVATRRQRGNSMDLRQMFRPWSWIRSGAASSEPKLENQADITDFVRRAYERSGGPNAKLVDFYRRGQASLVDVSDPGRPRT